MCIHTCVGRASECLGGWWLVYCVVGCTLTYMYAMLTLNAMRHASELVYCSLTYARTVLYLQVPSVSGEHGDVSAFHGSQFHLYFLSLLR